MTKTARQLTTYCGLWCKDCVPYQHDLYDSARKLKAELEKYNFREYAKSKAEKISSFRDYTHFEEVLDDLIREECTVQCYDGPYSEANCSPSCTVRVCAIERGYEGCWECDYEKCTMILEMIPRHPDMLHSLKMLKEYGISGWEPYRGSHHPWQKEPGCCKPE